ncbi:hypothetical protein Cgig2_026142 [Carnegiea gigantea]|uniref:Uncharacterized protein n=1 Tax=Carnegiea gigantea TaxID=171969 RepID=A0A9Q1JXT2_9CARY|nr:hypothetical protein Cgig2_026142 [Carnegiea gigantea]
MTKRKLAQRKAAAAKKAQDKDKDKATVSENHQEEEDKHEDANNSQEEQADDKKQQKKNEEGEQPSKAPKRARKRSKPDTEPEFFEDKRNLVIFFAQYSLLNSVFPEDLWKEVFPVGTEFASYVPVGSITLGLSVQLEFYKFGGKPHGQTGNAFEEGGELHGKKVYLFGCTEPQMVPFKDEMKITHVPVVVAVISPFPPSDKIGINSVQREAEEIVPMKLMKMDWVPYIPLQNRYLNPWDFPCTCNLACDPFAAHPECSNLTLMCDLDLQGQHGGKVKIRDIYPALHSKKFGFKRIEGCFSFLNCCCRSALRHLKEDRVKKFEYCLPYFYNPLQEDELEQSTVVQILFPIEPKPVFCEFDWEFDEVEEFTDKLIEEEELPADQKEDFKNFLKEKVREAKKANREAREARKKAKEEMSAEKKAAFENIRFYKFYPVASPDTPDVSGVKAPFINRYYGKAHQVF